MAENPLEGAKDSTRAEDIILNLSDKFAAAANAKCVYGEPVRVGNRTYVRRDGKWLILIHIEAAR